MSALETVRGGGSRNLRRGLAAVGYVAVALAVLTAFVPAVGEVVVGSIGVVIGSPVVVVLLGLVSGAYGLLQFYRSGHKEIERQPLVTPEPERAHYRENRVAGADVDESIDAVEGELPESEAKNWWTYREKNDVKTAMVSVAVDVLANEHDVSREAAAEMVAEGSWTDDERAAAFLGDSGAGTVPLRAQFFDWLSGAAYQRRAEATIDVIAAHAGLNRTADDERSRPAGVVDGDGAAGSAATTDDTASSDWSVPADDHDAAADGEATASDDRANSERVVESAAAAEGAEDAQGAESSEGTADPYPVNDGGGYVAGNRGDDE